MLPKLLIIIFFIMILMVSAVLFMGMRMQKDIPFQEIVPLDKKIAVINSQQWFQDDLIIELVTDDSKPVTGRYDEYGICVFENLENDRMCTINVKRTDLKGMILYRKHVKRVKPIAGGTSYVVLVGASIGRKWNLSQLPQRQRVDNAWVFGSRAIYEFDKSRAIDNLVNMPVPVKSVILKECSAYFPRPQEKSEQSIKLWVKKLEDHDIRPILATTVPVTREHDAGHPGRFESILKYNDFIIRYAGQNNIPVLDLEKALRISEEDRHLRDEYAQPDGNHLVQKAYDESLDSIVFPVVHQAIKQQ